MKFTKFFKTILFLNHILIYLLFAFNFHIFLWILSVFIYYTYICMYVFSILHIQLHTYILLLTYTQKKFMKIWKTKSISLLFTFHSRISNRNSGGKILDGSLSDTQTYAEVKPEYSSYAMWLKHSNTAGSRLSEGDSLESLQIGSPGMTRHGGHKLLHRGSTTGDSPSSYIQSPRLNRSNSIR